LNLPNTLQSATPSASANKKPCTRSDSKGDSYDNDLADTIMSLYKTELIRRRDPWKGLDDVEYATLECVDWSTPPAPGADRLRSARRV
jgi:hypothetical protein